MARLGEKPRRKIRNNQIENAPTGITLPKRSLTYEHLVSIDEAKQWTLPRGDIVFEKVEHHELRNFETHEQTCSFSHAVGPFHHWERHVSLEPQDGAVKVKEKITYDLAVPVWAPLFRFALRRHLRRPPQTGKHPWWAPPQTLTEQSAVVLSLLCVFALVGGYLGTLLTQTITYAAEQFDASTLNQGQLLAAVRLGVLLSFLIAALADRKGRRKILLWALVGACVVSAASALAPSMWWLGTAQTFARALSTVVAIIIGVMLAEEMPAGSRAFAVSVITMTAALGAGLCVANLLYADAAIWAWRIAFVLPLLAIIPCLRLAKGLPETTRFTRSLSRSTTSTNRRDFHWRRFIILGCAGFLWSSFLAPAAQFLNEFLRTERDYSSALIAVFVIATNTPGGIGIIVGGRLADMKGRKLIGVIGIAGGVFFTVVSYLVFGIPLWIASIAAALIGAIAVPALAVYGPELFPTHQRGSANGGLQIVSVLGSSVGLLLVGWLSNVFDSIGTAMAVAAIGPIILLFVVWFAFPETARIELEELNPGDRIA